MADDNCLTTILDPEVQKKLFGDRDIPKDLLRRFAADIESMKIAADQNPDGQSFPSRVNEYLSRKKVELKVEENRMRADLAKRKYNLDFYKQAAFKTTDPAQAFISRITGGDVLSNAGLANAEGQMKAINDKLMSALFRDLRAAGLEKQFLAGGSDEQIRAGVWALEKGSTPDIPLTPEETRMAKIISDHNKRVLQQEHFADIPTRMLEGRAAPRMHAIEKVRSVSAEEWINDVRAMGVDPATFGSVAGDVDKENEVLRGLYRKIRNGQIGSDAAVQQGDIDEAHGVNFSNKLSSARSLIFADHKGDFLYNQKYGRGNLAETIMADVNRRSRMLGLVKVFGSNPEKNLQREIEMMIAHYGRISANEGASEAEQSAAKASAESLKQSQRRISDIYHNLSGQAYIPGTGTIAGIERWTLAAQATSKLFFTQIKSLANLPTTAVRMSDMTGKNVLQTLGEGTYEWLKTLPPGMKDRMMEDTGFFLRDWQAEMANAGYGMAPLGKFEKFSRRAFVLAGHTLTTQGFKTATANMLMKHFAAVTELGIENAHPQTKATLLGMGLDARDFKLLGSGVRETSPDPIMGSTRKLLTPEAIAKIAPEEIQSKVKTHLEPYKQAAKDAKLALDEAKGTDGEVAAQAAHERAKLDLKEQKDWAKKIQKDPQKWLSDVEDRYMGALIQAGNVASTTAGARERSVFTGGRQQGDWVRMMTQLFGQFKTYWLQDVNIMKQITNAKPDLAALEQGVLKSAPGPIDNFDRARPIGSTLEGLHNANAVNFASWIVGSTIMGFAAKNIGNMYKGTPLLNPRDPKSWAEGAAYGGAGGIFMDSFAGTNKYYGIASSLLGPTFGQLADATKPIAEARDDIMEGHGIQKTAKKQTVQLIRNNIPFQQFPGPKQFLDYLQYKKIEEYIDPGSGARRELKALRQEIKRGR